MMGLQTPDVRLRSISLFPGYRGQGKVTAKLVNDVIHIARLLGREDEPIDVLWFPSPLPGVTCHNDPGSAGGKHGGGPTQVWAHYQGCVEAIGHLNCLVFNISQANQYFGAMQRPFLEVT